MITAGAYREMDNGLSFGKIDPDDFVNPDADVQPDWHLGNPYSFNDKVAKAYSGKRWGRHEGFNGAIQRRFRLIAGKRWFRDDSQARLECAMVFSLIHALGIEQREREAQVHSGSPPPQLALAA